MTSPENPSGGGEGLHPGRSWSPTWLSRSTTRVGWTRPNGKYEIGKTQFTSSGSSATVRVQLSRSDGTTTVTFIET